MIRRPTRLLRPAAVWLSLAVLLATLALAQPFRRLHTGFIHRHYTPPTQTLRTIHLTAHDGGVWFDWAYHSMSLSHPYYPEKWTRLMADHPRWWQRFDSPGGYSAEGMTLGFFFLARTSTPNN